MANLWTSIGKKVGQTQLCQPYYSKGIFSAAPIHIYGKPIIAIEEKYKVDFNIIATLKKVYYADYRPLTTNIRRKRLIEVGNPPGVNISRKTPKIFQKCRFQMQNSFRKNEVEVDLNPPNQR